VISLWLTCLQHNSTQNKNTTQFGVIKFVLRYTELELENEQKHHSGRQLKASLTKVTHSYSSAKSAHHTCFF
jgi:hypothetical protein